MASILPLCYLRIPVINSAEFFYSLTLKSHLLDKTGFCSKFVYTKTIQKHVEGKQMDALVILAGLGLFTGIATGWVLIAGSVVELYKEW